MKLTKSSDFQSLNNKWTVMYHLKLIKIETSTSNVPQQIMTFDNVIVLVMQPVSSSQIKN